LQRQPHVLRSLPHGLRLQDLGLGMRFWILLAALIGYHIPDVWNFLRIWKHYRPEYPGMVVYAIVSPGWLFFHSSLFVGLANAAVYGLIAYLVLLAIAKVRKFRRA
jgi:hypothetical protein